MTEKEQYAHAGRIIHELDRLDDYGLSPVGLLDALASAGLMLAPDHDRVAPRAYAFALTGEQ